jgi:probable phosphoglycerate mutase
MSEDMAWDDLHHLDDTGNKNWAFGCQGSKLIQIAGNWHDSPLFARCKAAEQGYRRIATASDEFLSRLGYTRSGKIYRATNPNNKRIAAFCHHGLGTSWLSHMLNIPPHIFWASFNIAHSSVSIINFGNTADGDVSPQCVCLSDISHIFKNNLPVNMPGV